MNFEKLFEPIKIGGVTVRNRIVMPPMVMCYAGPNGEVTEEVISHFEARARGGVGLIIVEASYIHTSGKGFEGQIAIDKDYLIPGLSRLTDAVKKYGAAIAIQLYHGGIQAHVDQPVGPSAIGRKIVPPVKTPRELTTEEVEQLVEEFANAALRAKKAGFDMVEVHGTHGYLINEFLSPLTNKRTDKYGEDKVLFAEEIVKRIKEKCGKDFPVIFRLCADEFLEGGITVEYAKEIAKRLEKAGVDAFDITGGNYDTCDHIIPPVHYDKQGYFFEYAAEIKKVVSVPVISGGMITDPEIADKAIREGKVDLVFVGRQLLADPEWPNKVKRGKIEDIRPCIACNEGCIHRIFNDLPVVCAVNPLKGFEYRYLLESEIPKAKEKKKVLIVGGGIGGLEFARAAKLRGHEVVIFEKSDKLGGLLWLASVPEFKRERLQRLIKWYEKQVEKLGIEVKLNTEVTPEVIKEYSPDVVVLATGSEPIIPKIPGVENAVLADDVLLGRADVGESVIIIGGGMVGCELAIELAKKGKKVTIVEALCDIAPNEPAINRIALIKFLTKYQVEVRTKSPVIEIRKGEVDVVDSLGRRNTLKGDTIVLAVGRKAHVDEKLLEVAKEVAEDIFIIGDAKEPRKIIDAVREGFWTAINI
ncbi:NADH:flavin oxidoreductase [Thermococcus sp. M39]|uniref:NAD(P)/FAD-dependent oxidoreductase n=1 Tax=unclassified Thermococcus TaxID=2627626 RepID=UPI00143B2968|nr:MULTISPECIES: NAD(P)/FAD-dependent oxidoreductase [unclassified Thermococcus]NJE08947.1 NADH:flavin oxidoreductase [Thermococcus sp. M39]NJE12779.1 NADH:flavin oxidoreductase [Thermococcus sp. LS2]